MAYVPPALRNKSNGQATASTVHKESAHETTTRQLYRASEIIHFFWPDGRQIDELPDAPRAGHATLNASSKNPHELAFMLLFFQANPRWSTDKIIFAKSNIDLLPPEPEQIKADVEKIAEEADRSKGNDLSQDTREAADAPAPRPSPTPTEPLSEPIAVFEQQRSYNIAKGDNSRNMAFTGWHRITRLQRLEPNSPELIRMMEQKWAIQNNKTGRVTQKYRDPEKWAESLNQKWVVIQMVRDQEADNERGTPKIEVTEEEHGGKEEGKSVNDMLKEMRLGGGKKDNTEQASSNGTGEMSAPA